jgi:hypothetical protein
MRGDGGVAALRGLIQRVQLYSWSPINFRDLISYLTCGFMSQVISTAGGLNDCKTTDSLVYASLTRSAGHVIETCLKLSRSQLGVQRPNR